MARIRTRDRTNARSGAVAAATHFWSGWDPAHPVKSLQPPWVKMDDVGDFDLPSPPKHMHPPPPPPSFWAGMVHGDSTQGAGAEAGFGGLYGFEEDRYLPPPPQPPPHVPPPIPPPPPKGPEAAGGDDFIERSAIAHSSPAAAAVAAADERHFVNEFDPNSPITAAGGVPSDPKRALIDRLSRYKPLFGQFELPANNRLWQPPADARTVGGKQPFAIPKPQPSADAATTNSLSERQFIPPHLLPGAPSATEPAPKYVPTVETSPAVAARFDPTLTSHSS